MSAILAEANGLDRAEADAAALATFGLASWEAFADAHAQDIRAALDRLSAPCDRAGHRLLEGSRKFLMGGHWPTCIAAGWPIVDVFGVAEWSPLQRRDVLGLVPAAAFAPKAGRRLETVTETGAVFRDPDGREITFRRPSLHADLAGVVVWWESPALINAEAA